jgi:hypothetical protein
MAKSSKKGRRPASPKAPGPAESDLTFASVIAEYEDTIEGRTPLPSGVRVVSLSAEGESLSVPEGSGVAYFTRKGNHNLRSIEEAVRAGDLAAVEKIHARLAKSIERRIETSQDREPRQLASISRFAELRYGSKTIARAVYLETPGSVEARVFAYNGGKLLPKRFRLVQYAAGRAGAELEALVVLRPPVLSPLEKKILAQVPAEQSEANISVELAFIGKIVRAVVNGGKKLVQAVAKITRKTIRTQLMTVSCPACPSDVILAVNTVSYFKVGGKTPTDKLPEEAARRSAPLQIAESSTAADLLQIRKSLLFEKLYD